MEVSTKKHKWAITFIMVSVMTLLCVSKGKGKVFVTLAGLKSYTVPQSGTVSSTSSLFCFHLYQHHVTCAAICIVVFESNYFTI